MLYLKIVPILMLIPTAVLQVSGQCPQNKYGPDCRYDCHCGLDMTCQPQTGCNRNCAVGWDGTTCQRQNVALNRPTSQSTTSCGRICYNSSYAVDGSLGQTFTTTPPCTHTTSVTHSDWTVTLDSVYNIYSFKIYNRNQAGCGMRQCGARLNKFILSVSHTSTQNYQLCYEDTTTSEDGPGATIERTCSTGGPISGNSVRISLTTGQPLTLCEVLLYVCSSGWYGELCDQPCGHCWNNNACDKETGDCPLTTGNRTCAAGYKGDTCTSMCDSGNYGPDCGEVCGFCAQGMAVCNITSGDCPDVQPRCMPGKSGSKCKTDCLAGTYGTDCKKCGSCAGGPEACNVTSGFCMSTNPKCLAGFQGDRCNQSCDAGTYGINCSGICGSCADENTECDTTSGNCQERPGLPRCKAGYSGPRCDQVCNKGKWGSDCETDCGHCYGSVACNKSSGECPAQVGKPHCDPGYLEKNCSIPCPDGTFGNLCQESCGHCLSGNLTCDHSNGVCPNCAAEWQGDLCKQEKVNPTPVPSGLIGGIAGGAAGAVVIVVVAVVVIVVLYRSRRSKPTETKGIELSRQNVVDIRDEHIEREPSEDIDVDDDDVEVVVNQVSNEDPYEIQVSPSVPIEEFTQYAARKKATGMYKTEFDKFPVGLNAKHDAADLPINKAKSRYRNLVAYDHSRVMLLASEGIDETDYINACYVNGYNEPKKFIASQGPTGPIINDFMRMLWEQNVGKVIMVTNLVEARKEKCMQYWPNEGSKRFGVIEITLLVEEEYANFVIRTLQLTHAKIKDKTMTIKQFHFTTWPDHGVPVHATPLLEFREKVLGYKAPVNGPIVVHCSAGIGRTGTFIALDYLINQADVEEQVDVPGCVFLLRKQRVNMIQTEAQYEFLHEALVEALTLSRGSIPSVNFSSVYKHLSTVSPVTGKTKMAEQFKALKDITPKLNKAKLTAALNSENISKNRSNKILAADNCRPFLSTPVAGCNNYINAVFLPSYRLKRGYILTQTPLPKTVVDFWRLVFEHSVSTIVMLDQVETGDKNVGDYLPDNKGKYDSFEVDVTEMDDQEEFSVGTCQLSYKNTKAAHPIKHFRCKFWSEDLSAESIPSVLTVIEKSEAWQQRTGNEPILVCCRDGVSKSGLYCTAATVIERLKIDQEVNILQTIKQMRINRPEIIGDLYQFHFLHQIVMGYLESFGTYANFS